MATAYEIKIRAKLALILSILGFSCIALNPGYGALPGIILSFHGIYFARSVLNYHANNDFAKISFFFSLCAFAMLATICMMMVYVNFL